MNKLLNRIYKLIKIYLIHNSLSKIIIYNSIKKMITNKILIQIWEQFKIKNSNRLKYILKKKTTL